MYSVAIKNRETTATLGYLRLRTDGHLADPVPACDKASHFIAPTTAALVRERHQGDYEELLVVEACACPTGIVYATRLRPT